MKNELVLIGALSAFGGLIALYRHWDPPERENDKILFLTKKQIQLHSLILGNGSVVTGIIILLYIIFS